MNLYASLFARLSDPNGRTASVIDPGTACRFFPDTAPAGTAMPYVVYSLLASTAEGTHDKSSDLDRAEVQFACHAASALSASRLRRAVRIDLSDRPLDGGEVVGEFYENDGFSEAADVHVALLGASIYHDPSAA